MIAVDSAGCNFHDPGARVLEGPGAMQCHAIGHEGTNQQQREAGVPPWRYSRGRVEPVIDGLGQWMLERVTTELRSS